MRPRVQVFAAPLLTVVLLATFAMATGPGRFGVEVPDSLEYLQGAVALLQGGYVVNWDGVPHVPRYSPGFALTLAPAIVVGGVEAAPWVPYLFGLALGATAAVIAARVAGPLAAPLTVATVLLARAPAQLSGELMSDIPTAALGVMQLGLLALGSSPVSGLAAGLVAGSMVWIRPASVVVLLAGLLGLTARKRARAWSLAYLAGALPVIAALFVWQALMFGSPLTSGYQAAGYGGGDGSTLGSVFSLDIVLGEGGGIDPSAMGRLHLPTLLFYPLALAGADAFLCLPGVGLLGLFGLIRLAPRVGAAGVVGRFGLAATGLTLVLYMPFFWRAERFLLLPAALLGIGAGTVLVQLVGLAANQIRAMSWYRRSLLRPHR
jgi:hypothetical protein